MSRILAHRSNPFSVLVGSQSINSLCPGTYTYSIEKHRNRNEEYGNASQQRVAAADAEIPEELPSLNMVNTDLVGMSRLTYKQREDSAESRTKQRIASKHGRRVLRVRDTKIIEDAIEERNHADGEKR